MLVGRGVLFEVGHLISEVSPLGWREPWIDSMVLLAKNNSKAGETFELVRLESYRSGAWVSEREDSGETLAGTIQLEQ